MRNLYGMIALALFSTASTNAMAAEPIECSSPNHNACFSFEPEEIPTIIDFDMCQYRQQAGISTVFDGETYFVTIDPNAPGAAGVPLAFLPEHNGEWESWEQLNRAFEQLLIGTGCHGVPLPQFPTPDLCNPTGAGFNFDFRANMNWLDPMSGELIPSANMDAFYGAFTDVDGRIQIPDVGEFDLGGESGCVTRSTQNAEGDTLTVKQCSRTVSKPGVRVDEVPCGPGGNSEKFPSFFEEFTSRNHFAYYALNEEPTVVNGDSVELYTVFKAEMQSQWHNGGTILDTTSKV